MTPEEIKNLVREYAEDIFGDKDYYFKEDDMCNAEGDFESAVTFLSKDYCIVEKSKINTLQSEIFNEIMDAHDADDWQSVAHYILDVMPRSFRDVFGKSLFE